MFGFIRRVIAGTAAPQARLFINSFYWRDTLRELNRRGREEVESGAFLLGCEIDERLFVRDRVFFDDLDPHCADTGGLHLDHRAFGVTWNICKARGLSVIADVHTHPGSAHPSPTDERNPAVSIPGHIALIVPNFGRACSDVELGVYEYLGNYRWNDRRSSGFLTIAWWA